jgi:hypothetical protein
MKLGVSGHRKGVKYERKYIEIPFAEMNIHVLRRRSSFSCSNNQHPIPEIKTFHVEALLSCQNCLWLRVYYFN